MAIKRVWHGWTRPDNADAYQRLLHEEIFPSIEAKAMPGYRRIELLRREHDDETEFITIMTFDALEGVRALHGGGDGDVTRCYVPDAAQRVLARWDEHAQHYEVIETRRYD